MSGAASRRQHQQFCDIEGWQVVLNARGKAVGHHITYELPLNDGRVLRTRVSRPANTDTYGPSLWTAILRDHLDVTEAAFWDCVRGQVRPPRPTAAVDTPPTGLPASLVHQLKTTLGLSDSEVASMTKEEAVARMSAHWLQPPI